MTSVYLLPAYVLVVDFNMPVYINEVKLNMILIYAECRDNSKASRRSFHKRCFVGQNAFENGKLFGRM